MEANVANEPYPDTSSGCFPEFCEPPYPNRKIWSYRTGSAILQSHGPSTVMWMMLTVTMGHDDHDDGGDHPMTLRSPERSALIPILDLQLHVYF